MKVATPVVTLSLLSLPLLAFGAEVFGGYSTLRLDGDNTHGGTLAVTWPLTGNLRLETEASGQLGRVQGEDLREWAILAGPVFVPWGEHRLSPFVHAKAGVVRTRRQVQAFDVAIGSDGVCAGACPAETGLAAEFGGGLDIRVKENLALRLPQIDYRVTSLDNDNSDGLRVCAGIVYRWGR